MEAAILIPSMCSAETKKVVTGAVHQERVVIEDILCRKISSEPALAREVGPTSSLG